MDAPAPTPAAAASLPERVERYEASLLREALAAHKGDVRAVIEALGLPRKTFYDKLTRHGIDPNEYRAEPIGKKAG